MAFLLACLLAASASAVGPGENVQPLQQKTWTLTLYVVGFGRADAGHLTGLHLAWIPPEIEYTCLGHQLSFCQKLPQERRYDIDAKSPSHLLTEWVSLERAQDKKIINKAGGMKLIRRLSADYRGSQPELFVEKSNRVKALVQWTLWPNGESFRVLDLK